MKFLQKFKLIKNEINNCSKKTNLIVVTKNQDFSKITHLINEGHKDFGENRIQEAKLKWEFFFQNNSQVNLHFIGKLQSNKIKGIGNLFNFIHSLDNIKNAELLNGMLKVWLERFIPEEKKSKKIKIDDPSEAVSKKQMLTEEEGK